MPAAIQKTVQCVQSVLQYARNAWIIHIFSTMVPAILATMFRMVEKMDVKLVPQQAMGLSFLA
jgi:hypothetical protein